MIPPAYIHSTTPKNRNLLGVLGFLLLLPLFLGAQENLAYRIYLDADQSHLKEAGNSILNGFRTALAESDNKLGETPVEFVVKNHRRNTLRSQLHLREFKEDPRGLLVVGGVHSPPILASRDWINENGVLFLDPWAAAGPITRAASGDTNWIFRLSVDDTKAGAYMVGYMKDTRKFQRPFLLLEETKWGDTNLLSIQAALRKNRIRPAGIQRFPWHFGAAAAARLSEAVAQAEPDCILFVGNTPEAQTIFSALLNHKPTSNMPVISHWGITAGDLWTGLPQDKREAFDLCFIQTAFSFSSYPNDEVGRRVLTEAKAFGVTADLPAPVGFIHAYDLGRILVTAAEQAKLTGNVLQDRERLRVALESLDAPVPGLVKTYRKPFRAWRPEDPDAHEALGMEELSMGAYRSNGTIHLLHTTPTYPRAP